MESFIELATEVKQHTIRLMSGWLSETATGVGIAEEMRLKIVHRTVYNVSDAACYFGIHSLPRLNPFSLGLPVNLLYQ